MAEHVLRKGRTEDLTISLFQVDGLTEVLVQSADVIRVKIGRRGVTPILDIDSVAPLAGGSRVTLIAGTNDCTLRVHQNDTSSASIPAGAYNMEVALVDADDSNVIKHAQTEIVHLIDSPLGDVGLL